MRSKNANPNRIRFFNTICRPQLPDGPPDLMGAQSPPDHSPPSPHCVFQLHVPLLFQLLWRVNFHAAAHAVSGLREAMQTVLARRWQSCSSGFGAIVRARCSAGSPRAPCLAPPSLDPPCAAGAVEREPPAPNARWGSRGFATGAGGRGRAGKPKKSEKTDSEVMPTSHDLSSHDLA